MAKLNNFTGLVRSLARTGQHAELPTMEVPEEYIVEVIDEEEWCEEETGSHLRPPPPPHPFNRE